MKALTPLNGPDTPFGVAELRARADPKAGPEVWVVGYVSVADCTHERPGKQPCAYAQLGDYPYSRLDERILVGGIPQSWSEFPPLTRVRVLATFDERVTRPLDFSADPKGGLNYIRHLPAGPVQLPPAKPTYPDGSWSAEDLFRRHDLRYGEKIAVTGYAVDVYTCPRCPRGVMCKPCMGPYFVLSDDPSGEAEGIVVAGYPSPPDPAAPRFQERKRYRVDGTFEMKVGGMLAFRGGELVYEKHRPVP